MRKNKKTNSAKKLLELAWKQYLEENDDFYDAIHQVALDFNNIDDMPGIVDAGLVPIDVLHESLTTLHENLSQFKPRT